MEGTGTEERIVPDLKLEELEEIAKDLLRHRGHLRDDATHAIMYVAGVLDVVDELRGRGHVTPEVDRFADDARLAQLHREAMRVAEPVS